MKIALTIIIQFLLVQIVLGQESEVYIPYQENNLWSVSTGNGKVLFEPRLEMTYPSTINRIRFKRGNTYGFIGPNGQVIIKPIYEKATDFYYFGGKTQSNVSVKDSSFFIDINGQPITPVYGCGGAFSNSPNGLFVFQSKGKYGLLSLSGDTLLKPVFSHIKNYDDGSFVVAQNFNGKCGLINWKGDTIHPFTLDSVRYESSLFPLRYYKIYKAQKIGVVNLEGEILVHPKYESLELYPSFSGGLCWIARESDVILGYVYNQREYWKIKTHTHNKR